MNTIISLGIIISAMLILSMLQLIPGVFAIFYHYALGKTSRKKANKFGLFFIVGIISFALLVFILTYCLACLLSKQSTFLNELCINWVLIGIFIAVGLSFFFFYYRKGSGTKLFISRNISNCYQASSKKVKTSSDAFLLGFISGMPELPFSLPLFFIISACLINLIDNLLIHIIVILLTAISVSVSSFITLGYYNADYNLANIERFRTKNKSFFKTIISLIYFLIVLLIIVFRIIHA